MIQRFSAFVNEEEKDNTYSYMLLSRLQSDCEYYLGHGNRSVKRLWAGTVDEQIKKMKELWNGLPKKPEWLSMKDIEEYEEKMKDGPVKEERGMNEKNMDYSDNMFKTAEKYEPALVLILDSEVTGDKYWADKVAWIKSEAESCNCEVLGIIKNNVIIHSKHGGVSQSDQ